MIIAVVFRYLISTNIIIIMVTGRRTKAPIWWIKIQEGATSVPQSFWDVSVNQALPYSSASAGNIFPFHSSSAAAQLHHMWIFRFFSFEFKKYFIYKIKMIKTLSSFIRVIYGWQSVTSGLDGIRISDVNKGYSVICYHFPSQAQWYFTCSHQGKACNLIKLQVQTFWQSLRGSNDNNKIDRQVVKRSENTFNCTLLKENLQWRGWKCCLQQCPRLSWTWRISLWTADMLLLNELR